MAKGQVQTMLQEFQSQKEHLWSRESQKASWREVGKISIGGNEVGNVFEEKSRNIKTRRESIDMFWVRWWHSCL